LKSQNAISKLEIHERKEIPIYPSTIS